MIAPRAEVNLLSPGAINGTGGSAATVITDGKEMFGDVCAEAVRTGSKRQSEASKAVRIIKAVAFFKTSEKLPTTKAKRDLKVFIVFSFTYTKNFMYLLPKISKAQDCKLSVKMKKS